MIKFFRRLRQQLLSQNKFSKYLLYAIGEIILVVIGILIALTLNNTNEKNKLESQVIIVFEDLLEELATDINNIKKAALFYNTKDSLTHLVLRTTLTEEDYQNNFNAFSLITSSTTSISLSNNSYNKLVQMSEYIPVAYKEVMDDLYVLNQKKTYVDYLNTRIAEMVNGINAYNIYNYSWGVNFNRQDYIDYLLHDSKYKSDVKLVADNGMHEHFQHAGFYLRMAIQYYIKIATLLNKPIDYALLGYNAETAKMLVGDWVSESFPGVVRTIFEENHRLLHKFSTDNEIRELFFVSDTKLILNYINFFQIKKEKNETILIHNNGNIWKKING